MVPTNKEDFGLIQSRRTRRSASIQTLWKDVGLLELNHRGLAGFCCVMLCWYALQADSMPAIFCIAADEHSMLV